MFKRFTNRQLLIALGVLAGLYLLSFAFGGRKARTFRETVAVLDTAQVNQLRIMRPGTEPVELVKNGPDWQVRLPSGQLAPAEAGSVSRALGQITRLVATQLMSRREADWASFKVDSTGTRLQAMAGEGVLLDLVIGRSDFQQTRQTSYVRLADETEVYGVSGFLEMSFSRARDDWRDRTILKGNRNDWAALNLQGNRTEAFAMLKGMGSDWMLPDSTLLDRTEVNTYLTSLGNVRGSEFADGQIPAGEPDRQLLLTTTSGPLEVRAYARPMGGYLISSTQNPGAVFADGDSSLTQRIFPDPMRFLPTE